jgi:hypothetical protein
MLAKITSNDVGFVDNVPSLIVYGTVENGAETSNWPGSSPTELLNRCISLVLIAQFRVCKRVLLTFGALEPPNPRPADCLSATNLHRDALEHMPDR